MPPPIKTIWIDYLTSGASSVGTSPFTLRKIKYVNAFSLVGISSFFVFGTVNIFKSDPVLGVIEVVLGIVALVNVLVLRRTKNADTATGVILALMIFILGSLFILGGIQDTGIFWFFTFPPLVFFLLGPRRGLHWMGLLFGVIAVPTILREIGYVDLPYSLPVIVQFAASLLAVAALTYFSSRIIFEEETYIVNQHEKLKRAYDDIEFERDKFELQVEETEKFKEAVQWASDPIVITDALGKIVYANKAAERATGYTLFEMKGNQPSLWGVHMDEAFYRNMRETVGTRKEMFEGEVVNQRKNGTRYDALLHISPVTDRNEDVKYFVGIERDITKEKQIDRAKSEFVSLASHQLRTPLAGIRWYAELLLMQKVGDINEKQKKFLEEVLGGAVRMAELVRSLLQVSRLEMGRLQLEIVGLSIPEVADAVASECRLDFEHKELTLERQYEAGLPNIQADRELTFLILQNLMTNAVKYTPRGGTITLSIYEESEEIVVSVADTGIGIPAHVQDEIFSKFFRAENAKKIETSGTGLGLYMVKSILEQVGGRIWFDSAEEGGTTFFVAFPKSGMKQEIEAGKHGE